jgi:hypothetical protein
MKVSRYDQALDELKRKRIFGKQGPKNKKQKNPNDLTIVRDELTD